MARHRYRDTLAALAQQPWVGGLPETPYLAARVTFADVEAAAGLTRSSLYRQWESQYEFWVDLSRYLAYEVDFTLDEAEMPWNVPVRNPSPVTPRHVAAEEVDELMSSLGNAVHAVVCDDIRILIRAGSLGYPDVSGVGAARQHVEASRLALLGDDVASTVAALNREFTEPYAESMVAASMWCIADGLSVLNHFVPERCGGRATVDFGHGTHEWSMLALAARALYLGCTRPRNRATPLPTLPPRPTGVLELDRPWNDRQLKALHAAARLFVASISDPSVIVERPNVLGYVTVARVAALAGVSRRTIYNAWPTRDDMIRELLDDLLREQRVANTAAWEAAQGTGSSIGDATRVLTTTHNDFDPVLAFKIEPGNPTLRSAIAAEHRHLLADSTARIDAHLSDVGRVPRDGLRTDHIALLWTCLVRGARRLRRTSPRLAVDFDLAADALVAELTVVR